MANPTAAMLVIGDEILSGRTQDANLNHLAARLSEHGVDLEEARIVRDVHDKIVKAVRELSQAWDFVFTTGGIGPTHDDITADAVAESLGARIAVREDARAILEQHCISLGLELNEGRLRMARIPDGASLIVNSVSAAPGFRLGNVHVMAGVPKIFRAMLDEVLKDLPRGSPMISRSLEVYAPESELAGALGKIARKFPDLQVGSYPFRSADRRFVNVVVRGMSEKQVLAAEAGIRRVLAPYLED